MANAKVDDRVPIGFRTNKNGKVYPIHAKKG